MEKHMRGLGDFQRGQMRQGDPRIREIFSRVRQLLDLFEDIANHPHRPPQPEIKPERPTRTPEPPAVPAQSEIAPGPAPLLVSIKEARRLIGISHTGIYKLINAGRVETVSIGKRRMVRYASLEQLTDVSLPPLKTTARL